MITELLGVSQELVAVLYYNFTDTHQLYLDVLKLVFWREFSQKSRYLFNTTVFFSFTNFIFCVRFYILFGFNMCLFFFYFKRQIIGFLYKSSRLLKMC